MKKFPTKISAALLCLILNIHLPLARAQTTEKSDAKGDDQPKLQCSQSPAAKNEKMTYRLGGGLLSAKDKEIIRNEVGSPGLIVPKGESEYAEKLQKDEKIRQKKAIADLKQGLKDWQKANKNAPPEKIKEVRESFQRAISSTKNPRSILYGYGVSERHYDWRKLNNDVGPVQNQLDCNVCWAFAATDAAYAAQQKAEINRVTTFNYFPGSLYRDDENAVVGLNNPPRPKEKFPRIMPSVQELVNCMPIEKEKVCEPNWHGRVFDFFVYEKEKGVPISRTSLWRTMDEDGNDIEILRPPIFRRGVKERCDPSDGFQKATAWGYVKYPPHKLPTVLELKTALIVHGPLVMPIFFDNCLRDYKGGVFNERNMQPPNHALLLVGWDDEKQAWLIKNSWGTKWGENGFGWVKYGSNNIGKYAAWIDM
jgi:Papain family cysteine protease